MTQVDHGIDINVRPYEDGDEPRVLSLLAASLGGGPTGQRSPELFRWKHLMNPFGRSLMILAEADGDLVGLRAFMRWTFASGDREVRAVRAVDTATHPAFQGMGIFTRLTKQALEALRPQADFIFNTPNEKSIGGYLKMGWLVVGRVPIGVRVRRPMRFLLGSRSDDAPATPVSRQAPAAAEALLPDDGLLDLLRDAEEPQSSRLHTPRQLEYLWWRYGEAPLLGYQALPFDDGGRLRGLGIFRVRPRGKRSEMTIQELIVRQGDRRTARELLKRVLACASVDHATCHFPGESAASFAAKTRGFLRSPGGMTLVVNKLAADLEPDPERLDSWALSLGDLEVF